jgi:putative ABC transport system permease protein
VGEILADEDFRVSQAKRDVLEGGGFQIGDIFLMISSFAILAGILLIVNIYTMLAEERKGELGILRAVALSRAGVVRLFVYEATPTDLPRLPARHRSWASVSRRASSGA